MGLTLQDFSNQVIETESMKSLWIEATQEGKLFIAGPKGVGKTTSLLYIFSKVRERKDSVRICLTANMMSKPPSEFWIDYMKSFSRLSLSIRVQLSRLS